MFQHKTTQFINLGARKRIKLKRAHFQEVCVQTQS